MALTELLFGAPQKVNIGDGNLIGLGAMELDCSVDEVHSDEAEITEHVVEEGSNISDHIRKLPSVLEITGLITNTPIVFLASLFAKSPVLGSLIPSQDRVSDGYDLLLQFMDNGVELTVVTSLREYSNMAMQTLTVRRNKETGQALDCTIIFKEILKAKAFSVDLPIPQEVQNNNATNQGDKTKNQSTPNQTAQSQSALSKMSDAGQSLFGSLF
jgi:hypothetical protein